MRRKLPGLLFLFVLICLLSASIAHSAEAKHLYSEPDVMVFVSLFHDKADTLLSDRLPDDQHSLDPQIKNPRPTSTPVPIPPPPDPGSVNLMVFFGVIIVLIILFGVWINRQHSEKKDSQL
jgi:hypothetical protein